MNRATTMASFLEKQSGEKRSGKKRTREKESAHQNLSGKKFYDFKRILHTMTMTRHIDWN